MEYGLSGTGSQKAVGKSGAKRRISAGGPAHGLVGAQKQKNKISGGVDGDISLQATFKGGGRFKALW